MSVIEERFKSFDRAVEVMNGRDKGKRLKSSTYMRPLLVDDDGTVKTAGILYHSTYILIFRESGVEYQTDGWYTVTTKDRMNTYGPGYVYQHKGKWFMRQADGTEVPYFDGMEMSYEGYLLNPRPESEQRQIEQDRAYLVKRIEKYLDKIAEYYLAGNQMLPTNGDCMFCRGWFGLERDNDTEHLLSHIEEDYVVPSLLLNAWREARLSDTAYVIMLGIGQDGYPSRTSPEAAADLKRRVRQYLKKRLLIDDDKIQEYAQGLQQEVYV